MAFFLSKEELAINTRKNIISLFILSKILKSLNLIFLQKKNNYMCTLKVCVKSVHRLVETSAHTKCVP